MNKLLTTLLLVAFSAILSAQPDVIVISRPVSQGFNYVQNTEIQATEFSFPERIDEFKVDTASGVVAVHLRGLSKNGKYLNNSGNFVLYDLKTQMPLWSKKINFQTENISMTGNQAMLEKAGKLIALNMATGAETWTSKTRIFIADQKSQTGIGYKYGAMSGTSDNLEGIDMQTGNTTWKRNLDQTYGWNSIKKLNDSVLLITSAGLHTVNLHTGQGWDYKTATGKKQTGEAVAKSVGSVVLGVLTGVMVVPNVDIITGLVSNTLVDSTGIYLASAEKISRLNSDGQLIWSNELPKDLCSSSVISRENGFIYLINKGYAYENGKMRNYGHPFVAIYNENDGTQLFFKDFDEKKLMLNDIDLQGDTINLLFYNKFAQFSIKSNSALAEKTFDTEKTGYLYNFANKSTYFQENDTFVPARKENANHLIYTSNGNVLVLNKNMEAEQELTPTDFHKLVSSTSKCKLLYNPGKMTVVTSDGKRLAEVKTSSKVQLVAKKLYDVDGSVLREIDLSEFSAE